MSSSPVSKPERIWILFILVFLALALFVVRCKPVKAEEVQITIKDFGQGMTPALTPTVNDPTRIVFSQNFFSTQPGGRQLRFGVRRMGDTLTTNDSAVSALASYVPSADSGAIIYTSAGKWWANMAGRRQGSISPGFDWKPYLTASQQVRPWNDGDSVAVYGDTLLGWGTQFTRDLQPGDTVTVSAMPRKVDYVKCDTVTIMASSWASSDTSATWLISRSYPTGTQAPFLTASGDRMFTGNIATPPQVIFTVDDTIRMRHLGIVDSFFIDTVYNKYPSTVAKWDSVSRRSWDTLPGGVRYMREFQLVSRRKLGEWGQDQWIQNLAGTPEAYYVRIGFNNKTAFFTISGNSDTSIYLVAPYIDTTKVEGGTGPTTWNDSLYFGKFTTFADTVTVAQARGRWGYIYGAAGFRRVVLQDSATGTLTLRGRGALLYTIDASFSFDSTELYKGLHFIHLTANDITFPAYANTITKNQTEITIRSMTPRTFVAPDTVVREFPTYWCGCTLGPRWNDDLDQVTSQCQSCSTPGVITGYGYVVRRRTVHTYSTEAQAISSSFFPIRYARKNGDTTFFISTVAFALDDSNRVSTNNWEIIRVGLPMWSGITEWNTPPQLVAWGDTASPALLSFSDVGNQVAWSATNDILLGNDPSEPIVAIVGYDDQLVVGKSKSMIGFDGQSFTELSQTEGMVSRRAVQGLTKEMYWYFIDGVYRMSRRDFAGYSIEKISGPLDPVFNSWNRVVFGSDVVPISINASYRNLAVLTYNQRDRHLYLFAPFDTSRFNNACLTYDVQRNIWDGYFTITATDAIWTTINDTSRIVIGSHDSATVFALDYSFNDLNRGINGEVRSGQFWIMDEQQQPMFSKFQRAWVVSRSLNAGVDSAFVLLTGDANKTDTLRLAYPGSLPITAKQIFRPSKDNVSVFWRWSIKVFGNNQAAVFQPMELSLFFTPYGEDF